MIFILLTFMTKESNAYPNFISYGYQSCLACHYNPYGNGPLTDYGRAVGASTLSDRKFFKSKISDDQIAQMSDFFMGYKKISEKKSWLRPSASYRGIMVTQNPLGEGDIENRYITMDAGAGLTLKFLNDQLYFVGTLSYAPPKGVGDDIESYRSREHYVGYRISPKYGVYVGMMDKVFGLRIADHTAFSRTITNLNQNDQTHGAVFHYSHEKIEAGLHAFIGNLVQDPELRQQGVSGQIEYSLNETTRVGGSVLVSSSDLQDINMQAGHLRTAIGKGNSIMLELGRVSKETLGSDPDETYYLMMQNHYLFRRGLWGILTAEAALPGSNDLIIRFGPGVQWFLTPRVELRMDLYNTKNYGTFTLSDDWYLASQLHLWF